MKVGSKGKMLIPTVEGESFLNCLIFHMIIVEFVHLGTVRLERKYICDYFGLILTFIVCLTAT